jgi:hypothetical protein
MPQGDFRLKTLDGLGFSTSHGNQAANGASGLEFSVRVHPRWKGPNESPAAPRGQPCHDPAEAAFQDW